MHFVLTLQSHLPYLLNHGRSLQGSCWLCQAVLDSYLPLLEALLELEAEDVPAPLTLGFTPVLSNQLISPGFLDEMEAFFRQVTEACDRASSALAGPEGDARLEMVDFWRDRYQRLWELFHQADGDLVRAFGGLESRGRLEIVASAATHAVLPLLGREESIRLQLAVGASEHERILGSRPRGCWVPECAYARGGLWDPLPGVSRPHTRQGIEGYLAEAGFKYFFLDSHQAEAGEALAAHAGVPHGAERFGAPWTGEGTWDSHPAIRSPYQSFICSDSSTGLSAAAFIREPYASVQIWSRHGGYPGDPAYLDVHGAQGNEGLRYWRRTPPDSDPEDRDLYDLQGARWQLMDHIAHFTGLLGYLQRRATEAEGKVAVASYHTELFGGGWFEGVEFLKEVYKRLPFRDGVKPVTASRSLAEAPPRLSLSPVEGSWGPEGDLSLWLNEGTREIWQTLWPLEERFWRAAPDALKRPRQRPLLAQAARELLLAQSSDWPFLISTGIAPDYGLARFRLHCQDLESLLGALEPEEPEEEILKEALKRWGELEERDSVFPEILGSLEEVLTWGSPRERASRSGAGR